MLLQHAHPARDGFAVRCKGFGIPVPPQSMKRSMDLAHLAGSPVCPFRHTSQARQNFPPKGERMPLASGHHLQVTLAW